MNIIGFTRTNWNIFDIKASGNGESLKAHISANPQRAVPDASNALTNKADVMAFMDSTRQGREDIIRSFTGEREAFHSRSASLQGFVPGQHGTLSVEDEIRLATETGNAAIIDGKLTPSFSLTWTNDPNMALGATTDSVLDFEQRVDNLRRLFEHLGDDAVNYTAQFDNALNGIIDDLFTRGGMFINADREGVADSIRAMFNGTEGIYTADDIMTMAVLSFEAAGIDVTDSEVQVGMRLGMNALSIQMARDAGRLSDAAYATVREAFAENANDLINQMNIYLYEARKDSSFPRNVSYTPVRPELIQRSIDIMLSALDSADFNQGLREAIDTLKNMHNAQRESQLENGMADQRFNMPFVNPRERVSFGDEIQVSSQFFTEFLNRPDFAINGNPFSVSVSA